MSKHFNSFHCIKDGDMSGDVSSSNYTSCKLADRATVHIEWSGTAPVGSVVIEVSMSDRDNEIKFYQLDEPVFALTGNSGSHDVVLPYVDYFLIRVKYVRTSGVGTLNATINTKSVGA